MELCSTELRCERSVETWTLHHLTDTHIDDSDHAEKELAERIAEIKADPKALWIGGGDYASLILPNDPRFQTPMLESVHRLPDVYLERCEQLFGPIRDKCVGIGIGNHETTIGKYYHRGVGAELAMRLGIPQKYLGVRGWSVLKFKWGTHALTLMLYQFHGWSAGRLKGRKALQAERDVGAWRADVLLLGHDHQPYNDVFYSQECYGTKSGYKLRNRPVAVVNGGAWTYGQRPPASAGTKIARKASEWPNEPWSEGRNFRPQPPVSPVVLMHLDLTGSGAKAGKEGRPVSFDLETRLRAPSFDV
jgi:hypothetical protein